MDVSSALAPAPLEERFVLSFFLTLFLCLLVYNTLYCMLRLLIHFGDVNRLSISAHCQVKGMKFTYKHSIYLSVLI